MTTVNQSFLGVSNLVEPLKTLNTGELSVSGALVLDSLNSLDSLEVGKVNTEVVSNAPTMDGNGTLTADSTDVAGSFVVTTNPATLTFGKNYTNAPVVLVQNAKSGEYHDIDNVTSTASNFVVSVPNAAVTGATTYNYVVIG